MEQISVPLIHPVGIVCEMEGLLRSLYRDLDTSLRPFELAVARGDRHTAIELQSHIEFLCAAMLVIYEKKNLALIARAKACQSR